MKNIIRLPIFWLVLSLIIVSAHCSIGPVFFRQSNVMEFQHDVDSMDPIGMDFKWGIWRYCKGLQSGEPVPYIQHAQHDRPLPYPPFVYWFFMPLGLLSDSAAFQGLTSVTFLCFLLSSALFPLLINKHKQFSAVIVFGLLAGLYSYGLRFELERGQFNVIAMTLCFFACYLFHYHYRLRYLAFALFSFAVQLKVYPAIFILMFVKDWKKWKTNILHFSVIGAINLVLLFVLGIEGLKGFLANVHEGTADPFVWAFNHSIKSFVMLLPVQNLVRLNNHLCEEGLTDVHLALMQGKGGYSMVLQSFLFVLFAVLLSLILWRSYKRNTGAFDPYLLLGCVIGAHIIPAISHDYKLPILIAPVIVVLDSITSVSGRAWERIVQYFLLFLLSLCFCATFFSNVFKGKAIWEANNFLNLMVILIASVLLMFIRDKLELGEKNASMD